MSRYFMAWLCLVALGCSKPHVYHHTAPASQTTGNPSSLPVTPTAIAPTAIAPTAVPPTASATAKTPQPVKQPAPRTKLNCAATSQCKKEGRCLAKNGQCVALSYADCIGYDGPPDPAKEKSSQALKGLGPTNRSAHGTPMACRKGKCTIEQGACKAVKSCSESYECKTYGLCGERKGYCYARTQVDCHRSVACNQSGSCTIGGGRCHVGGPKNCAQSEDCRNNGRCSYAKSEKQGDKTLPARCYVATDADCLNAKVCREGKACAAVGNRCIVSCQQTDSCKRAGRCTLRPANPATNQPAACIVGGDTDCAKSKACLLAGACGRVGRRCAARDDVSCLRSNLCKEQGRCHAKRGRCGANSNIDCQRSTVACAREGRCRFQNGTCVK